MQTLGRPTVQVAGPPVESRLEALQQAAFAHVLDGLHATATGLRDTAVRPVGPIRSDLQPETRMTRLLGLTRELRDRLLTSLAGGLRQAHAAMQEDIAMLALQARSTLQSAEDHNDPLGVFDQTEQLLLWIKVADERLGVTAFHWQGTSGA